MTRGAAHLSGTLPCPSFDWQSPDFNSLPLFSTRMQPSNKVFTFLSFDDIQRTEETYDCVIATLESSIEAASFRFYMYGFILNTTPDIHVLITSKVDRKDVKKSILIIDRGSPLRLHHQASSHSIYIRKKHLSTKDLSNHKWRSPIKKSPWATPTSFSYR